MKNMLKRWFRYGKLTFRQLERIPSVAYSTQAAFFMIISAFPMIMLLLSLISFFPIDIGYIQTLIFHNVPNTLYDFVHNLFDEIFNRRLVTIVSITAITLVWSASTGIMALIRGLNAVYGTRDNRKYLTVRALSVLYTTGFVLIVCFTLVLLVFGRSVMDIIVGFLPSFAFEAHLIAAFRYLVMFIILTLYFAAMFTILPKGRIKFLYQLPGAILASVGWMGFSYGYSLYLQFTMNDSTTIYGSLSAIVFIMLWLYFCMFILFVGAAFNNAMGFCRKVKKISNRGASHGK